MILRQFMKLSKITNSPSLSIYETESHTHRIGILHFSSNTEAGEEYVFHWFKERKQYHSQNEKKQGNFVFTLVSKLVSDCASGWSSIPYFSWRSHFHHSPNFLSPSVQVLSHLLYLPLSLPLSAALLPVLLFPFQRHLPCLGFSISSFLALLLSSSSIPFKGFITTSSCHQWAAVGSVTSSI